MFPATAVGKGTVGKALKIFRIIIFKVKTKDLRQLAKEQSQKFIKN